MSGITRQSRGSADEAAIEKGLEQKASEFTKAGAELYAKA
jgi:hypothetical protein